MLLKAAALAARQVPQLNGYWTDEAFQPAEAVHLGMAISLRGGGLHTPAIHDAPDLRLDEPMTRMRDLVTRARGGRLRGSELSDATITVTSLGDQGAESVYGVIYPPQVALVGFGPIIERPVAVGSLADAREWHRLSGGGRRPARLASWTRSTSFASWRSSASGPVSASTKTTIRSSPP